MVEMGPGSTRGWRFKFGRRAQSEEDEPGALSLQDVLARYKLSGTSTASIYRAATTSMNHGVDLDAPLLFAAFLADAGASDGTGEFLSWRLKRDAVELMGLKDRGISELPGGQEVELAESLDVVQQVLETADQYRKKTTPDSDEIHPRHVFAVLLRSADVRKRLQALDFNLIELRNDLYEIILRQRPEEDAREWRRILLGPGFEVRSMVAGDTWTISDNLGYRLYAEAIADSLLNERTEPPLTIGIQAPWGQGKTSLMRMIQEKLDPGSTARDVQPHDMLLDVGKTVRARTGDLLKWLWQSVRSRPKTGGGMLRVKKPTIPTVWFNPLYYRDSEQVWAGMGHAILQQLAGQLDPLEREKFWLHLQIARMNAGAIRREVYQYILMRAVPAGLAAALLVFAVGVRNFGEILIGGGVGTIAAGIWAATVSPVARRFEKYVTEPDYQSKLGLLHLVDHDLDKALSLLVGHEPIAVFIDDLDRCDPQTVSQVILAINQFLSLPRRNVFFFLGMDMEMVAAALEQAQKDVIGNIASSGRSFGWRFMEKFIQLPFVIPRLDENAARAFAMKHLSNAEEEDDAEVVARALEKVKNAKAAEDVGVIAKEELAGASPAAAAKIQSELCRRAAELIGDPDGDEVEKIVAIAIEDLDLNPRTIKRYFALVRLLRNVQLATGQVQQPDFDRKLVLRAAHLLMNWPQFVQWLRATSHLADIESIAASSDTDKKWFREVKRLLRGNVPAPLMDASLYRFVHKIVIDKPGLAEMHAARMF